jgi:hypothetical protein
MHLEKKFIQEGIKKNPELKKSFDDTWAGERQKLLE